MGEPGSSSSSSSPPPPVPDGFNLIKEGQAAMLFPTGNEVFYNKVQVFNRDLSVLMLQLYTEHRLQEKAARDLKKQQNLSPEEIATQLAGVDWQAKVREAPREEGIRVLDALAASGLRSIRYFKEVPGIKEVVVNDLEPAAVAQAERNVEYNRVDPSCVRPQQGDAVMAMHQNKKQFDVVDLDPYGSAAPFMDAAVQAVVDGGLLCVTCTDLSVLSGNYPEVCYSKYRSVSIKASYMHEMAVRIVLGALESHANMHQRHIVPVASLAIDFYLRCFVRVYTSKAEVKKSSLKLSYVYQSTGCPNFYLQPVTRFNGKNYQPNFGPVCPQQCPETGSKIRMAGPIWSAPIYDPEWVAEALARVEAKAPGTESLATTNRIHAMLTVLGEELHDVPLFYNLDDLARILQCNCPKIDEVRWALINAGYRVSSQHKDPKALKTDASPEVLWDIMRCWVKKHPNTKSQKEKKNDVGPMILAKEPTLQADFRRPDNLGPRPTSKIPRFLPNPEANWGPKKAHTPSYLIAKRKRTEEEKGKKEAAEASVPPPGSNRSAGEGEAGEEGEGNKRAKGVPVTEG